MNKTGTPLADESDLPESLRATTDLRQCDIYEAADWYDVDYAGYVGELAFYRLLASRLLPGESLVEIGAGTGRITRHLANLNNLHQANAIVAVEPAAGMRLRLKARLADRHNVTVVDALADNFVARDVALVLFAFNGLLHLSTDASMRQAFAHIYASLAKGGVFAFDVTVPYWEAMAFGPMPWGRSDERVHHETGARIMTCDRSTYRPADKTIRIDIRYREPSMALPMTEVRLEQRMWTPEQLIARIQDAGFVVQHAFGDVDLAPFVAGSPRLLLSAQKPF